MICTRPWNCLHGNRLLVLNIQSVFFQLLFEPHEFWHHGSFYSDQQQAVLLMKIVCRKRPPAIIRYYFNCSSYHPIVSFKRANDSLLYYNDIKQLDENKCDCRHIELQLNLLKFIQTQNLVWKLHVQKQGRKELYALSQ